MRSLSRAVSRTRRGGAALPEVFKAFTEHGVSIRRGEVSMIAGEPGAGKSTLALKLAVASKVPTLYFSADTHAHTMAIRTVAMLAGYNTSTVESYMDTNRDWARGILRDADHIRWCFDPAPSMADIEEEIEVYREVMGANPELIVVDNAVDITHETGDEFSSLRNLMREVKWTARDSDCAVLILHHTSEAAESRPCPPRRALHGKVAQVPALIITLGQYQNGDMALAVVKNRYGRADASGQTAFRLRFDPASMWLGDSSAA